MITWAHAEGQVRGRLGNGRSTRKESFDKSSFEEWGQEPDEIRFLRQWWVMSVNAEKTSDKTQHPFMIKASSKLNRRKLPQPDKDHLCKTTVASKVNGETLKAFLRLGTKQGCPLSRCTSIQHAVALLARAVRQESEKACKLERKK